MFLKNCWYVAAPLEELASNTMVARRILNVPLILFQTSDGGVTAMEDRCPHRLVPLSMGVRENDSIRCGYHGMLFDQTGRCTEIPGQKKIPDIACVKTFPLVARHGQAWIWLGDSDLADPALIPEVPWACHPDWTPCSGYTHMAADYRLVSDNLLDLSHETYIHARTIGNGHEESIAEYPLTVKARDNLVVTAGRHMPGITPPPFFAEMLQSDGPMNRWQTAIWLAPSVNLTKVVVNGVGCEADQALVGWVTHLLTPETESSTHYFWSFNRNFRRDDEALTASIRDAHYATFAEDQEMLERQQIELADTGDTIPKVALQVDDAPLRARRYLSSLIRREQADGAAIPATPALNEEEMAVPAH